MPNNNLVLFPAAFSYEPCEAKIRWPWALIAVATWIFPYGPRDIGLLSISGPHRSDVICCSCSLQAAIWQYCLLSIFIAWVHYTRCSTHIQGWHWYIIFCEYFSANEQNILIFCDHGLNSRSLKFVCKAHG